MPTQILLVDDEPNLREALQQALEAEGFAVSPATDAGEALAVAADQPPALVVLNLSLPGALEACRRLWLNFPDLTIIPLVAPDAPGSDLVVKPATPMQIVARIRAHLRRGEPPATTGLEFADLRLDLGTREARRGERAIALTATEFELLRLFIQHPRQILTRDFLYERVWGHDFEGESKVLEIYVHYLRRKLEAGGEPRLLHTVRSTGYVLREPV